MSIKKVVFILIIGILWLPGCSNADRWDILLVQKKEADNEMRIDSPTPLPTPARQMIWSSGLYTFNGTDDYVSLPQGILKNVGDFTLSAAIFPETMESEVKIFDFSFDSNIYMYMIPRTAAGYYRFAITRNGYNNEERISGTLSETIPLNSWSHVAVSLNQNVIRLYLNGVEVKMIDSITLSPKDLGDTGNNYIGKPRTPGDPYFDGKIDQFQVYNYPLTANEISALAALKPADPPVPSCISLGASVYGVEMGGISGGITLESTIPGYNGTQYAYISAKGETIQWSTASIPEEGYTLLKIRYSNGDMKRHIIRYSINGNEAKDIGLPVTGSWSSWSEVQVYINLPAGINTVVLTSVDSTSALMDEITIGGT